MVDGHWEEKEYSGLGVCKSEVIALTLMLIFA